MTCPTCGNTALTSADVFCPNCGTRLKGSATADETSNRPREDVSASAAGMPEPTLGAATTDNMDQTIVMSADAMQWQAQDTPVEASASTEPTTSDMDKTVMMSADAMPWHEPAASDQAPAGSEPSSELIFRPSDSSQSEDSTPSTPPPSTTGADMADTVVMSRESIPPPPDFSPTPERASTPEPPPAAPPYQTPTPDFSQPPPPTYGASSTGGSGAASSSAPSSYGVPPPTYDAGTPGAAGPTGQSYSAPPPMYSSSPQSAGQQPHYQVANQYEGAVTGQPPKDSNLAFVIELVPGLLGFLGIGHMYAGNVLRGVALLLGWGVFLTLDFVLIFILGIATLGIGFCLLPLIGLFWLAGPIASAFWLKREMDGQPLRLSR